MRLTSSTTARLSSESEIQQCPPRSARGGSDAAVDRDRRHRRSVGRVAPVLTLKDSPRRSNACAQLLLITAFNNATPNPKTVVAIVSQKAPLNSLYHSSLLSLNTVNYKRECFFRPNGGNSLPSHMWADPASFAAHARGDERVVTFPKASVAPTRKQRSQGRAPLRRRAPTQTAEKKTSPPNVAHAS